MSTITPLHFGPSDAPLFGTYHAPATPRPSAPGVVLCAPFGTEYLLSHPLLRRTAEALAGDGYHVLRFDWTGTGDSAGEATQVTLEQWSRDLLVAIEELRDMSGTTRLVALGVGLGASVALRLASGRTAVRHIVAWDPVVQGDRYLAWLSHTAREPALVDPLAPELVGVFGAPMPAAFRRAVAALDLRADLGALGARLTVVARRAAMDALPVVADQPRVTLPDDTGTMERALRTGHLMLDQRVIEALLAAVRQAVPC